MTCPKCRTETVTHLTYKLQENNTRHLMGFCVNDGWVYVPFIKGLDIPTTSERLKSKKGRDGKKHIKENLQESLL